MPDLRSPWPPTTSPPACSASTGRPAAAEGRHGAPLRRRPRLGARLPTAPASHPHGTRYGRTRHGCVPSLILDEAITPAVGASAANRAYPLSTHLRGLAAHLAFGLAIAFVTELAWKAAGDPGAHELLMGLVGRNFQLRRHVAENPEAERDRGPGSSLRSSRVLRNVLRTSGTNRRSSRHRPDECR